MTKVLNEIKVLLKSSEELTQVDILAVGGAPVYSFNGIPVHLRKK